MSRAGNCDDSIAWYGKPLSSRHVITSIRSTYYIHTSVLHSDMDSMPYKRTCSDLRRANPHPRASLVVCYFGSIRCNLLITSRFKSDVFNYTTMRPSAKRHTPKATIGFTSDWVSPDWQSYKNMKCLSCYEIQHLQFVNPFMDFQFMKPCSWGVSQSI